MERNFGNEIDELKRQLEKLTELISKQGTVVKLQDGERVHRMNNMHPDERFRSLMEELCDETQRENRSGTVAYLGVFESGGRQSNWINRVNTDDLLPLIESGSASKVLTCIGSTDRLNLLLAILRQPSTVAQLIEKLGFGSSGQVYHHLKPLLNADLVIEDKNERGKYIIQPHRVQGIIMLLTGIADMLNSKFTTGTFDTEEA